MILSVIIWFFFILISFKIDIRRINRQSLRAINSGMIILGGGVTKHHICNANLMVGMFFWYPSYSLIPIHSISFHPQSKPRFILICDFYQSRYNTLTCFNCTFIIYSITPIMTHCVLYHNVNNQLARFLYLVMLLFCLCY